MSLPRQAVTTLAIALLLLEELSLAGAFVIDAVPGSFSPSGIKRSGGILQQSSTSPTVHAFCRRATADISVSSTVGGSGIPSSSTGSSIIDVWRSLILPSRRQSTPLYLSSSASKSGSPAQAASTTPSTAEAAVAAPPQLVQGAKDFETFLGAYRVRPKRGGEAFDEAKGQCILIYSSQGDDHAADGDVHAKEPVKDDVGKVPQHERQREQGQMAPKQGTPPKRSPEDSILVVEELDEAGGYRYVGFCGAIEPQETTHNHADFTASKTANGGMARLLDAYVCAQKDCELDSPTAALLVRALHGWLEGPDAAAGVAKSAAVEADRHERQQRRQKGDAGGLQEVEEMDPETGPCVEKEEEGVGEMVDWVDTEGRVVCALPRSVVHAHNVLHRGAGVMIRNDKGQVYCHRRTATKRVFPSMYDMFIGGVSGTMEPVELTALRELGEELNLGPLGAGDRAGADTGSSKRTADGMASSALDYRGKCLVLTEYNRCLVSVFDYTVAEGETIQWQEEEVDWGSYLSWTEVEAKVADGTWEFVPDGLQVWQHYITWDASAA